MDLSVIIPTHGRPQKVAACIRALAAQTLEKPRYEILVGIDGGGRETRDAIAAAWSSAGGTPDALTILECDKSGQASVRNRLFPLAKGRTFVFLNDDMIPDRNLLAAHLTAQREQEARPALIVGDAPWRIHQPDRLFDRLIRETSMVFFYDRMRTQANPQHDWGFRHAWMLNLSAPAALIREVGGLSVFPSTYGYEDDDLAFRLSQRFGTPVLYRPQAVATHDHRIEPREYLERERKLGFAAWGFAAAAPDCARAMFNRDIRSPEELDYSRQFVTREHATAQRLERSFLELAHIPSCHWSDADSRKTHNPGQPASDQCDRQILNLIYEQHLLLKRWHWRKGLLEAASEP